MSHDPEEVQIDDQENEENNINNSVESIEVPLEEDGEEEIRAPDPSRVDNLMAQNNPIPLESDETISNIDYTSVLSKLEKFFFPYIYDIFILTHDENITKKINVFNFITKTGLMTLFATFIQYVQILSLTMLPSLIWSTSYMPYINAFNFLRTFQLQYLFLSTYSNRDVIASGRGENYNVITISQEIGELFNYYIPLMIAIIYTGLLMLFSILMIIKKLRIKWMAKCFHIIISILPMMYIPVLNAYFNTFLCLNNKLHLEITVSNCFDLGHFYMAIISIILIIPFVILALFYTFFYYEWRPNTRNWAAKPHARFSLIIMSLTMFMVFCTFLFESIAIALLFLDFLIILILICIHIYFLEWYHKLINQIICSVLFVILFGSMVSILLTSFKMMIPFLQHSFTIFPGMVFFCSVVLAGIIGTLLTKLRFRVIGLTVNSLTAPRIFQMFYRLQPDEIVVPKGDFEVEIAAKTVEVYSLSVDKLNLQEQDEMDQEEEENDDDNNESDDDGPDGIFEVEGELFDDKINDTATRRKSARKLIEKVHTLYTNSLDVGMSSDYIALSYSVIHAFVMKDLKRAIQILVTQRADKKIFWIDIRLMYYMRLRYYIEEEVKLEKIRKIEEMEREEQRRKEMENEEKEKVDIDDEDDEDEGEDIEDDIDSEKNSEVIEI